MEHQNNKTTGSQNEAGLSGVAGIGNRGGRPAYGYNYPYLAAVMARTAARATARAAAVGGDTAATHDAVGTVGCTAADTVVAAQNAVETVGHTASDTVATGQDAYAYGNGGHTIGGSTVAAAQDAYAYGNGVHTIGGTVAAAQDAYAYGNGVHTIGGTVAAAQDAYAYGNGGHTIGGTVAAAQDAYAYGNGGHTIGGAVGTMGGSSVACTGASSGPSSQSAGKKRGRRHTRQQIDAMEAVRLMEHQNNKITGPQNEAGLSGVAGIGNRGGRHGYNYLAAEMARAAAVGGDTAAVQEAVGTGGCTAADTVFAAHNAVETVGCTAGDTIVAAHDAVGTVGNTASYTVVTAQDAVGTGGHTIGGTFAAAQDAVGTMGGSSVACTGASGGPSSQSAGREKVRRHTPQQVDAMETYFKDNPCPDQRQRNQLAECVGLETAQVKFWFQNKRSQVKAQSKHGDEIEALRSANSLLRAHKQQRIKAPCKNTSHEGSAGGCGQLMERKDSGLENIRLRDEIKILKSRITELMAGQNPHNLPITSQNPQNAPMISEAASNIGRYPFDDRNLGYASTGITSSGDVLNSIEPTSDGFRRSIINNFVVSAAEELKKMALTAQPLWIPISSDGATCELDEVEYLAKFSHGYEPTKIGYTREASRHIATVTLNRTQLLDILMNVDNWSFMFSNIVSKASTLETISAGVDYNQALHVIEAEFYVPTPLVPNRTTYFARYCTQHDKGVWAVVDVSLDTISPAPQITSCQKGPSGCLIQEMPDGTSKVTWIEHVYVDYNGLSTIYRSLLLSGLGFGAKRWVSTLERQYQRLATEISPNVSATHEFNNLLMSRPEGGRRILNLAERMVNSFISGITGLNSGRWTKVKGNFSDDIRLMSRTAMDHPDQLNGTVLSGSTTFVLPLAPKMVFDFFRDHGSRKKWDIFAKGKDYEPVCCISNGEASNCVSIYKVPMTTRPGHMVIQESWSDSVASHVVFSSTGTGSIDVILGGGNPNSLPILPSGFSILPDGSSFLTAQGSGGTLLTVSFQMQTNNLSPVADINAADVSTLVQYLKCSCQKIKYALGVVRPDT